MCLGSEGALRGVGPVMLTAQSGLVRPGISKAPGKRACTWRNRKLVVNAVGAQDPLLLRVANGEGVLMVMCMWYVACDGKCIK